MNKTHERKILDNLVKLKLKPGKVLPLYTFNKDVRPIISAFVDNKKVDEFVKCVMLAVGTTPIDMGNKNIGYYEGTKQIKIVFEFKEKQLSVKLKGKTYLFDLRPINEVIIELSEEKNTKVLKRKLQELIKQIKD